MDDPGVFSSPTLPAIAGEGWTLRLATPEDDAALCRLFASVHLKGQLDVTQERDPAFFALPRMHQPTSYLTGVGVADGTGADPKGALLGCGTVVVRPGWWQGRVVPTGYLCDLRVVPGFRGGLHLARAYGRFMDWVRAERGAELFTTVIFDANHQAKDALVRRSDKRKDQPVYRPMTPFQMTSVQLTTRRPAPSRDIRRAGPEDEAELIAFLAARAERRALGEVLDQRRFAERLALWPDFGLSSFFIARDRGRIVGCLAPWDTSAFKRTRVLGYHGKMAWMRRAYNLGAAIRRFPPLPRPGDCFRFAFLTHLEIEGSDPAVLHDLLLAAYADLRPRGLHFMSAFVPRGSPLEAAFSGFMLNRTAMTLYAVHPPDSPWADVDVTTLHPGFEMALS